MDLGTLVAWLLVRSVRRPFRRGWWLVLYLYALAGVCVGGSSPYIGFLVPFLPIAPGINAVILGTPAVRRLRRTELTPAKGLAIAGVAIGLVSILTSIPLWLGWWF